MKLRRDQILNALREAGTPITIDELAKRTGVDLVRLRVDLYRLAKEGDVERRQRGNVPVWTVTVRSAVKRR